MRSMRFVYVSIFFLLLAGCSTAPPSEDEVKNLVNDWYNQQNNMDGAGHWEVKGITVLSVKKDAAKKGVFVTSSAVSGNYRFPPLAEPKPDKPFNDTLRMDMEWNGAKWVSAK